jgi:hypothetical protein
MAIATNTAMIASGDDAPGRWSVMAVPLRAGLSAVPCGATRATLLRAQDACSAQQAKTRGDDVELRLQSVGLGAEQGGLGTQHVVMTPTPSRP